MSSKSKVKPVRSKPGSTQSAPQSRVYIITDARFAAFAVLLLRVTLGVAALADGVLKVYDYSGTVALFESIGLTAFVVSATITIEVGGGIALIVGACPRFSATMTAPILISSIFFRYW